MLESISVPVKQSMMNIGPNPWIVTLLILIFPVIQINAQVQSDSLETKQQDSLLEVQEAQSSLLASQADSIRRADSIEQAALLEQIAQIQASDQQKKAELQARLDSLQQAREEREQKIRQQVDSLRANTPGVPVVFFTDTLFYIYSRLGPFSPYDRASNIKQKLEKIVDDHLYDPNKLGVNTGIESDDVLHGEMTLLSITDRDAFWLGQSRNEVANSYMETIEKAVEDYRNRTGVFSTLKRVGWLLLVLLVFFLSIHYLNRGLTWLNVKIIQRGKFVLNGVKFKGYELLTPEREVQVAVWLLNVIKWVLIIVFLYLILPAVFIIFPATKGIANTLFGYFLAPLRATATAFVSYIPEIITIIVIIVITHYFVRLLKFLADEIETQKLQLPGFYPDWARPTYNLLRFIIYAFAFVAIFPNLPGSDSPIFQGVSVFLGLLISLGSSSAIGNIIAGLVITYMRPFKVGDRVKIGEMVGDVVEKTMLVTRLRTIKNEDVTIPNSAILNGSTTNYSANAKTVGLILNTTVTIGYDVPWPKVHELLIGAATQVDQIKKSPKPFVLQTSLEDFYVSYQLNAYTDQAGIAAKLYSQIHSNIQDAFNEAGVEILSPHYRAPRDGNHITIPPDYLPPDYQAPPFQVQVRKEKEE